MDINRKEVNLHLTIFLLKIVGIKGKIKAISTSKIIKIMAIKKNRIENGIREYEKKSYPHSKGLNFSRQFKVFFDKEMEINVKPSLSIIREKAIEIKINI